MKKVLIITTGFAPQNRIGAIRSTKFAKYLVRHGYNVTIITPEISENDKVDNTLISSELDRMRVLRIPKGDLFSNILFPIRNRMLKEKSASTFIVQQKQTLLAKIKNIIVKYGLEIYLLVESFGWQKQVKKTIKKKLKDDNFDAIISSYPKVAAHKIALTLLSENKTNFWIADFRDPMIYETLNSKSSYYRNAKLQKYFCENASAITYVTENMVKTLSEGISNNPKYHYLPNGFDEDDIKSIQTSTIRLQQEYQGVFKIAYVGSLYGGKRDISILFKKIRVLIDMNKIDVNNIIFFYAGKDFNVLREQALQYKLDRILVDLGYVSREESLNIQDQSNLIVVNTWNTEKDQGVIPGKVYECFLLKKPTLAITNGTVPNSELGGMINKAGLGLAYNTMESNQDMDSELLTFLHKIYLSAVSEGNYYLSLNLEYINQFNYKNITNNLIEIIEATNK